MSDAQEGSLTSQAHSLPLLAKISHTAKPEIEEQRRTLQQGAVRVTALEQLRPAALSTTDLNNAGSWRKPLVRRFFGATWLPFAFVLSSASKKHQLSFSSDCGLNLTHHRGHVTVGWGKKNGAETGSLDSKSGLAVICWKTPGRWVICLLSWAACSVKWRCWASLCSSLHH